MSEEEQQVVSCVQTDLWINILLSLSVALIWGKWFTNHSQSKCRTSVKLSRYLYQQSRASVALNKGSAPTQGFVTHAAPGHDGFLSNVCCLGWKGWEGSSDRLIPYWLETGGKKKKNTEPGYRGRVFFIQTKICIFFSFLSVLLCVEWRITCMLYDKYTCKRKV